MNSSSPMTKGHPPLTPRRQSISGSSQRPSTSSGDIVESSLLRDALMERKGLQQRARSTTPRRTGTGLRSQIQQDEWLQTSEDESTRSRQRVLPSRPPRQRRASDVSTLQTSVSSSRPQLGARETETRLDRLEKETWDLKHRLVLSEERTKRLNNKIEEQEKEIDDLRGVEQRCDDLEQELRLTEEQIQLAQEEITELHNDNVELTQINEELVQQMEVRVRDLDDMARDAASRQAAIEEAAGIIQMLEQRLADAEEQFSRRQPDSPPRTDSDYFSGEPDPSKLAPTSMSIKPPATANSAPESDYFSADNSSPLITPRSIKQVEIPAAGGSGQQNVQVFNAASMSSAAFNREVGLRTLTSKDSLLSAYLETPALPLPQPQPQADTTTSRLAKLKVLRRKTANPRPPKPELPAGMVVPSAQSQQQQQQLEQSQPEVVAKPKKQGRGWLMSNPLRSLYNSGSESSKSTPDTKEKRKAMAEQPSASQVQASELHTASYPPSATDGETVVKSSSTPSIAQVSIPAVSSTPEKVAPAMNRIKHVRSNSTNSRNVGITRHNTVTGAQGHSSPKASRIKNLTLADMGIPDPRLYQQHHLQPMMSSRSTRSASPEPMSMRESEWKSSQGSASVNQVIYTTPPTQTAPTFPMHNKPIVQTHFNNMPSSSLAVTSSARPSPNYASLPKRYPAWPVSRHLTDRGLFHGAGMDEMFGDGADGQDDDEFVVRH